MTKVVADPNKGKKNKVLKDVKETPEEGTEADELGEDGSLLDEGESESSITTEDEIEGGKDYSSGEDTDQLMAKALDTIRHQATESEIVVPPVISADPKTEPVTVQPVTNQPVDEALDVKGDPLQKVSSELGTSAESSPATPPSSRTSKRKIEVERRRLKKARKVIKEKRERLKAQISKQVASLTVASTAAQEQNDPSTSKQKIPKLPSARCRQQRAVEQAKRRVGLSSKYANLSKLVEFHRVLLKGNPFALVEPKQVYPHFHLIPGINSALMQPLIRAWQEKATRILYQLLLIETKGDIARLKKRSALFTANPTIFVDAFAMKVDIGLENDMPLVSSNPTGSAPVQSKTASVNDQLPIKPSGKENGPPLAKKSKKGPNNQAS